jgi:hypothetical protein
VVKEKQVEVLTKVPEGKGFESLIIKRDGHCQGGRLPFQGDIFFYFLKTCSPGGPTTPDTLSFLTAELEPCNVHVLLNSWDRGSL